MTEQDVAILAICIFVAYVLLRVRHSYGSRDTDISASLSYWLSDTAKTIWKKRPHIQTDALPLYCLPRPLALCRRPIKGD